jgi:hypothetical protein
MGIEEMFRDCQTGGYNLEGTGLTEDRLIKMILLMTIAYSRNILEGTVVRRKNLQKYVCRLKEQKKTYRRRSIFGSGNDSQQWINYLEKYAEPVKELINLTRIAILNDFLCISVLMNFGEIQFMFLGENLSPKIL